MTIKGKEVNRAILTYRDSVDNLLNANNHTYSARVEELINLIEKNEILKTIIGPFFEIKINSTEIQGGKTSGWYTLNLPIDEDKQIGFAFQL